MIDPYDPNYDPNIVHCLLCGKEVEHPNMELERHILNHRVPKGADRSEALSKALLALSLASDADKQKRLEEVLTAVRAEERLRFQTLVQAAEEVALTAGRVNRRLANSGPLFWYDV